MPRPAGASRSGYGGEAWEVGHRPEGLAEYLRAHPETWEHLRRTRG